MTSLFTEDTMTEAVEPIETNGPPEPTKNKPGRPRKAPDKPAEPRKRGQAAVEHADLLLRVRHALRLLDEYADEQEDPVHPCIRTEANLLRSE
jgi:hypothetical protein